MMISQRCGGIVFWKLTSVKLLLQRSVGFNRAEKMFKCKHYIRIINERKTKNTQYFVTHSVPVVPLSVNVIRKHRALLLRTSLGCFTTE
jgi:hypothetical protein